jgi:uncharacterized protein YacL
MNNTLLPIRLVFVALCAAAGWLVSLTILAGEHNRGLAIGVGLGIGLLVVLVDVLLKGFSLRGLSALTFGIGVGLVIAHMVGASPILETGDPATIYLVRLGLFVICPYLAAVIALRGKDEFNLVIPYVRFVLNELRAVADSTDPHKQARGRRGLDVLNELRKIKNLDIRIIESEVTKREDVDAKLVFLAHSMRAKLLTTDYNLAKMAEFHGVSWLNLNALAKSLRPELMLGERLEVDLVKPGKEEGQAIGFIEDGSMVVVSGGRPHIGQHVQAEIISVLPTAGGKMIFARLVALVDA